MSAKDILLKHVVPIAGGTIAVLMFGSPMKAVWQVRRAQHLGELNPIPFPVIAANCVAWCVYAIIINQPYLFVPNALGALFGMYMTSTCLPFASVKARDMLVGMEVASACLMLVLGAVTTLSDLSHGAMKSIWGFTGNAILFGYYISPLTVARKVIMTKDSSSLYWPFCVMNTINGCLWLVFGLATMDFFIAVPNGVGTCLSVFSVILCFIFPRVAEQKAAAELAPAPAAEDAGTDTEKGKQPSGASSIRDTSDSPDSLIRCN